MNLANLSFLGVKTPLGSELEELIPLVFMVWATVFMLKIILELFKGMKV